jgi:DNA polymerase-3 subunit delta
LKLAARQLSAHLRNELAPVYLIAGDEPLLVAEAAAEIVTAARARGFDQRDVHVADRTFRWSELEADMGNLSLFATRRVVELRLPTGRPGEAGARFIASFVDRGGPDDILLLVSPKLDAAVARSAWVKQVEGKGVLVQVWPLDRGELPDWLLARARRQGLELTAPAAELLADRVEGNLLAAAQEIEKLRLYHGAGRIDEAAVVEAVADTARFDVFRLTDALLAGDAARALRVLGSLRAEGTELVLISWALAREIGLLVRLKAAGRDGRSLDQALRQHGVWQRRHPLLKRALPRYSAARLTALLNDAAALDLVVKGAVPGQAWQEITRLVLAMLPKSSPGTRPVNLQRGAAVH